MMNDDARRMTARQRRMSGALGAGLGLFLFGYAAEAIELPADLPERAATCYGARVASFPNPAKDSRLTGEQINEAAHFLFLGASANGITEPTKLDKIAARGQMLQKRISADRNAADYAGACEAAFPETKADAFKGLPADSSDTRMMCYTLSTALLQVYEASKVVPDERSSTYVRLNDQLDARLLSEIRAAGNPNVAELAGRAVRGLAQAIQLGPLTRVMKACTDRYLES